MGDDSFSQAKGQEGEICPACRKTLALQMIDEGGKVHACSECKGVWVSFDDEKQVLRVKPEVFSVDELNRLRKIYKPLGRIEEVKLRACPVCRELMYRRNWGEHSGVIVDRCEKHGVWYDQGELEKIREYIKLGGLEYEKLRMTEKGLDELHSKLLKEATRLDLKIDSAYRRARLWSMLGF